MSLDSRITWIRHLHVAANVLSRLGHDRAADTLRFLGRCENSDIAETRSPVGQIATATFRASQYERQIATEAASRLAPIYQAQSECRT